MVALISVGRSLGSSVIRVALGLIRFASSRSVIGSKSVAVKSCRRLEKDLKVEEGLEAKGFRAVIFSRPCIFHLQKEQ
jgi:hypothetical protein